MAGLDGGQLAFHGYGGGADDPDDMDDGALNDEHAPAGKPASDDTQDADDTDRVAPFLLKLYEIVSTKSLDHQICWNEAGDTLRIIDPASFAQDVLPLYFKHNNLRSFIRQLNMYGFYRGPTKGTRAIEFFHERFSRGGRAQLKYITRGHVSKNKSGDARGGHNPTEWDMKRLLCESNQVHQYILKLEEELMGHIVQLHEKLATIVEKLGADEEAPPPMLAACSMRAAAGIPNAIPTYARGPQLPVNAPPGCAHMGVHAQQPAPPHPHAVHMPPPVQPHTQLLHSGPGPPHP